MIVSYRLPLPQKYFLKVMKPAASSKHRPPVKIYNVRKSPILTYILLKLGKCVEKHATSTYQEMAASMERLLVCLLM